jgi:hypothetical protein
MMMRRFSSVIFNVPVGGEKRVSWGEGGGVPAASSGSEASPAAPQHPSSVPTSGPLSSSVLILYVIYVHTKPIADRLGSISRPESGLLYKTRLRTEFSSLFFSGFGFWMYSVSTLFSFTVRSTVGGSGTTIRLFIKFRFQEVDKNFKIPTSLSLPCVYIIFS